MIVTVPLSSDVDLATPSRGLRSHANRPAPATAIAELVRKFLRFISLPLSNLRYRSEISTKREGKCLHAWVEEFNFERPVFYRPLLPDQLIQTMFLNRASAVCIGVAAMVLAGRGSIQCDPETNRLAAFPRSENQVQVPSVKPKRNFPRSCLKHGAFFAHLPASG